MANTQKRIEILIDYIIKGEKNLDKSRRKLAEMQHQNTQKKMDAEYAKSMERRNKIEAKNREALRSGFGSYERTMEEFMKRTGLSQRQVNKQFAEGGIIVNQQGQLINKVTRSVVKNDKALTDVFRGGRKEARAFKMEYLSIMFGFMAIGRASRKMWQSATKTYMDVMGENNEFLKQTNKVRAAWEFLKFSLVDALMQGDMFKNIIDIIIGIVDRMSEWIGTHPELGKWIMIIMGGLMAIAPVISGLASMMLLWGGIMKIFGTTSAGVFGGFSLAGVAAFALIVIGAWAMKEEIVKAYKAMKKGSDAELKGMEEAAKKYSDLAADHIVLAFDNAAIAILKTFEALFNFISRITSFIPEWIPVLGQISKASKGISFMFGGAADWVQDQADSFSAMTEAAERAVDAEVDFYEQGEKLAQQRKGVFVPGEGMYPVSKLPPEGASWLQAQRGTTPGLTAEDIGTNMSEVTERYKKTVAEASDEMSKEGGLTDTVGDLTTKLSGEAGLMGSLSGIIGEITDADGVLDALSGTSAEINTRLVPSFDGAKNAIDAFTRKLLEWQPPTPTLVSRPSGMQTGGIVPRTGPYMLHGGEYVTPKQSMFSAGGVTVNVTTGPVGSDVDVSHLADEVSSKIVDELRRTAQIGGL